MKSRIRGLGEVALRVRNLDVMQEFYESTIGLTLMKRFDKSAFFRIADGVAGHTQILALFDRSGDDEFQPPQIETSTVDHIAFAVTADDFEAERDRLINAGLTPTFAYHQWVRWRSLYVIDPEGNTVELVCYDETKPEER